MALQKVKKVYCESCVKAAKEEGAVTNEEAYDFLEIGSYMMFDHECDHVNSSDILCHCEGHV